MKAFMQKINQVVMIAMELILGIVILFKPLEFNNGIIVVMGILLCFVGVVDSVSYFRTDVTIGAIEHSLTKGILGLLCGIFIIMVTDKLASYLPTVYGLIILVAGVSKIQTSLDMFRMKKKHGDVVIVSAGISIILAVLIFVNPFFTANGTNFYLFIAIALIIEAVMDAVVCFISKAWDNHAIVESK